MSTQPPPTSAERLTARQSRSASIAMQLAVLGMGMAGGAVIAGVLGKVTEESNPIWVLPVIASGFVCFLGLLATTAWSMRSTVAQAPRPVVSGGIYLTMTLVAGGVVALASDVPRAAYLTPLVLAAVVAALTILAGLRRRARRARVDSLQRGTPVRGAVTDDGLAAFPDTPNLKLATLTVSFRDASGVERWVTVTATQSPTQPIRVGDAVDVWFDQSSPGDTSRIVVAHDNGASRVVVGHVGTGAEK